MDAVLSVTLPFFGLILLGFVAGKSFKQSLGAKDWLTIFVIYFTVPAMLFLLLAKAPIEELVNISFIASATGATLLTYVLSIALFSWLYKSNISSAGLQGAAASYSNAGYLGVPLALGALGSKAAIPATLIVCFDSILFFILVPLLAALGDSKQGDFRSISKEISQRILLNPLIVGSVLGILAAWFQYMPPAPIEKVLIALSAAAAPCALFTLGVTVASRPIKQSPPGVMFMVGFKLLLHPLIVFIVLTIAGFQGEWLHTALLIAALPTALGVYIMANQYQLETHSSSSAILFSTILSVATVSGVLFLIKSDLLPS